SGTEESPLPMSPSPRVPAEKLLLLVEHAESAVDQVRRAGDVVAVGRGKVDGQACDVGRLAEASERDLALQGLQLDGIVQQLGVDRRLDRLWRDAVDRDADRSELDGERP